MRAELGDPGYFFADSVSFIQIVDTSKLVRDKTATTIPATNIPLDIPIEPLTSAISNHLKDAISRITILSLAQKPYC